MKEYKIIINDDCIEYFSDLNVAIKYLEEQKEETNDNDLEVAIYDNEKSPLYFGNLEDSIIYLSYFKQTLDKFKRI